MTGREGVEVTHALAAPVARSIRENIRAGALRTCMPWRARLGMLFHPGGQVYPMPFVYRWRWRISRALLHGWAWVRTHEFKA